MDEQQTTDWELIVACRAGDARAWERVLGAYERLVFSIPLSYGLGREDAADITQLTFTALLQSVDALREDSRLGAWLATVARRHSWRALQQRSRETGTPLDELEERLALPGRTDAVERWEALEWLQAGLANLNQRCQQLLRALYFDAREPSYAELAERMNMSVGSIGPTRARCLERLKQLLDETQ